MKLVILVACAFMAVAVAAPTEPEPVKIVRSEFDTKRDGGYVFGFEAANGIVREEAGEIKDALDEENKPHPVVVVRGSYSYTDPEGKLQTITYVADEYGYKAEGDAIPKAPVRR